MRRCVLCAVDPSSRAPSAARLEDAINSGERTSCWVTGCSRIIAAPLKSAPNWSAQELVEKEVRSRFEATSEIACSE